MARRHDATGRTRNVDRFTSLPNFVLASEAVRTLPPSAFMVLVYLAMRCYGQSNNGRVVFANRSGCLWRDPEAQKWREYPIGSMSKSTIGSGLRELEARGLIQCTKRSGFDHKRLAKEYRLTWVKTEDAPPTNDFLAFKPGPPKLKARPVCWPVMAPIGQPTGQPPHDITPEATLQASQQAYSKLHRPAHRPLSNQCNSDVVEAAERDALNAVVVDVGTAVSEAVQNSVLVRGARAPKGVSATAPPTALDATLQARLAARKAR